MALKTSTRRYSFDYRRIDWWRLRLEWLVIAAGTAAVALVFSHPSANARRATEDNGRAPAEAVAGGQSTAKAAKQPEAKPATADTQPEGPKATPRLDAIKQAAMERLKARRRPDKGQE